MTNQNNEFAVLEGIISIKAVITAKSRKVFEVLCDENKIKKRDRKAISFVSFLKANNIYYTLQSRAAIDQKLSELSGTQTSDGDFNTKGTTHGGFIAIVGQRSFSELDVFLDELKSSNSFAVFLDGVEDPFNFGYSVRNLFAFGSFGFIVPERNWFGVSNIVCKASAGASELTKISVSYDDEKMVQMLTERNIDIVCAALSKDSVSLYDFKPVKPFVLFIGGEKRGISKAFMENASTVVHIPYSNQNACYSLPTASAAAIFGSYIAGLNA